MTKTLNEVKQAVFNGDFDWNVVSPRKLPVGHVIDENQSVVWNREQVVIQNDNASNHAKQSRQKRNELHTQMMNEIAEAVSNENQMTVAQAHILLNAAWESGHSAGMYEVFGELDELVNMIDDFMSAGK